MNVYRWSANLRVMVLSSTIIITGGPPVSQMCNLNALLAGNGRSEGLHWGEENSSTVRCSGTQCLVALQERPLIKLIVLFPVDNLTIT